jgi:hypothetical protein
MEKSTIIAAAIVLILGPLLAYFTFFPGTSSSDVSPIAQSATEGQSIAESKFANGIVTNIWLNNSEFDTFRKHGIKYLFVDIGETGLDGSITTPREEIGDFLEMETAFEEQSGYDFIILPYSEVNTDHYSLNQEFIDNMVKDYVYYNQIGFNGIYVDIEPVKKGQNGIYLDLLESLRKDLPDNSVISAYSGSISESGSDWEWDYGFFKEVSERTDLIVLQGFDLAITSTSEYNDYLGNQMEEISSHGWKSDFMLGIPTHKQSPETIENALKAYNANASRPFIGVNIFSSWTIGKQDWATFDAVMA